MPQIIGMILLVCLFIYAIPLAVLVVVLAGLIFRTKETIGILMIGGILAGFAAQPLIATGVVAVLVAISLYFKNKEKKAKAAMLPEPDD